MVCALFLNFLAIIFIGGVNAFEDKNLNKLYKINQLCNVFVVILSLCFSEFIRNLEKS